MARKSFSIHMDFFDELRNLTNEQLGILINELINWAEDMEVNCSDPVCAILFRLMTAQIERISQANSANGKKNRKSEQSEENEESEQSEEKRIKPTVTSTVSVSNTNITTITGEQIKDKQIKLGKYNNVVLSADEYRELLSEFGESTLKHYINYVDEWANNRPKMAKNTDWEKILRKAIAEDWGSNNTIKKKKTSTKKAKVITEADYDKPFIRRVAND